MTDIGKMLDRHRTSVSHGIERVEDRRDDAAFEARMVRIEDDLRALAL